MKQPDSRADTVPDDVVHRILARAAQLDAAQRSAVPVSRLHEASEEAGITSRSLEIALAEEADAPAAPVQVPWWVRVCLFGVVDRRVAMVFYWVFAAMLILGPLLMLSLTSPLGSAQRLTAALVTLGGAAFSLWSTARAVRWADRFGWDLLP